MPLSAPAVGRPVLRIMCLLCYFAILFATGDLWPSVTLGFTFRFSQLCLLTALALCPFLIYGNGVRLFPGWPWLYGFVLWLIVALPSSLFPGRSMGYTVWAITDVLIIFIFVQTFRSELALLRLIRAFLVCYTLLALFGLAQLMLGMAGIDILIAQWWIPGVLPRINGLSYEPSYYATYMLGGWVLSLYLLERRTLLTSRRLQKICAVTTTLALLLATSRLGWAMMILWLVFRVCRRILHSLVRGKMRWRSAGLLFASPLLLAALMTVAAPLLPRMAQVASEASFLISGLGIFGAASHSASTRAGDLEATWRAFLAHPVTGTGIGALPAEIAAQRGSPLVTLDDAKPHEGLSIFLEAMASTGLIGAGLLTAFAVAVIRRSRKIVPHLSRLRRDLLYGVGWSVIWLLLALQFSQNFLRLPLYIQIAMFVCCLTAGAMPRSAGAPQPFPTAFANH